MVCGLHAARGLQAELLDLQADGIRVSATAECGGGTEYAVCSPPDEDNCVRTCGRGSGAIAHGPELAVDGDRSTSWQSPPLSFYEALGETIGDHSLTVDLGRVRFIPHRSFQCRVYTYLNSVGSACGGGAGVFRRRAASSRSRAAPLSGRRGLHSRGLCHTGTGWTAGQQNI